MLAVFDVSWYPNCRRMLLTPHYGGKVIRGSRSNVVGQVRRRCASGLSSPLHSIPTASDPICKNDFLEVHIDSTTLRSGARV